MRKPATEEQEYLAAILEAQLKTNDLISKLYQPRETEEPKVNKPKSKPKGRKKVG